MKRLKSRVAWVLVLVVTVIAACGREPDSKSAPRLAAPRTSADAAWRAFTQRFIEESFQARPHFAVRMGRHEFDGKMPDLSGAGIAREIARLKQARLDAERFTPDVFMTPEAPFERERLLSIIDTELFWLERARRPFTSPHWYIEELDPAVYLNRDYAPLEKRLVAYIAYARAVPEIAVNIRANLSVPLPRSYVQRGIDGFGGYAEFYRTTPGQIFASVKDAALQKELAEVNEAAAKAMEGLKTWLESERGRATDNFALGESLFAEMLRQTERVEVPLAELAAAGRADLDRNLEALRAACAQFLPGAPIRACIEKMEANKPKAGSVTGAESQLAGLKAFITEQQLVAIPSGDEARVAEAPPYNRANVAYIDIPGPYEKGVRATYYIAPPDPRWTAAEQTAYLPAAASLLYTSVHEVWPGHFLQFLHSNRNRSPLARLWVSYGFAEGWAHYAEELMWEAGLGDGDPEQHIGQLSAALLRNVRFISAIGLHTQGMTLEESEQLFRDRAFADPGTARQQAARGTYDPAYLNYTLGKLMIRKLRADWIEPRSRGATAADYKKLRGAFHGHFLSHGGLPIPLVRKALIGDGGSLL